MGGKSSKPPPRPPPPPPPLIQFYNVYYDIPVDAQRRINDMNNQIGEKQRQISDLQWELTVARQNVQNMKTDRDYWIALSQKKQTEIDALNAEIADLQSKIDELNKKITKSRQSLDTANAQTQVSRTSVADVTEKVIDETTRNIETKTLYTKAIQKQNSSLSSQYDELRGELTKGDVLSEYTSKKSGFFDTMNWILFITYFILVVLLLITFFLVPSNIGAITKLIILIVAIIYPFIIMYIENFVYYLFRFLKAIAKGESYRG